MIRDYASVTVRFVFANFINIKHAGGTWRWIDRLGAAQ